MSHDRSAPKDHRRRPLAALAAVATLSAGLAVGAAPAFAGAGDAAEREAFRRRLAALVEAVETYHVDAEVGPTRVIHGAIRGMLDTLDPHTNFLDSSQYQSMRESQDGSFYGLGIIISVRRDRSGSRRLTVISPIDGTPAKRLGIRPGDVIAAIDGESTDDLSLDGAVAKLRGRRGTTVKITIERAGSTFDVDVERDEIPTESVPHAYLIEPGTGFIRVKDFSRSTKRELDDSIERLLGLGMQRLILDLRDNPGGLLDSSVEVASTFLDRDDLIVETRGRVGSSNETHRSIKGAVKLPAHVELIALVNRGSASASEIVAGALQDHDRGLVVGTTSWGKGLVQSVYSLSSETGLALTTARYYTPSGRQIQRDYRSSYFDYYFPPSDAKPEGAAHRTDGGREVHSGGGIEPDVLVEGLEPDPLVSRMVNKSIFYRFARRHVEDGLPPARVGRSLSRAEEEVFRKFVAEENLEFTEEEWTRALPQVRLQVEHELANHYLGWKEGFRVLNDADPQVQAALKLLPHAARTAILEDARRGRVHEVVLAERGAGSLPDVVVRTVLPGAPAVDPERRTVELRDAGRKVEAQEAR